MQKWIPAFAGMTDRGKHRCSPKGVIPAKAGIHFYLRKSPKTKKRAEARFFCGRR